MIKTIQYELSRIFKVRANVIFIFLFTIIAIYTVYSGVMDYKDFKAEKSLFLKYEDIIFHLYMDPNQYGDGGFRLLFDPSEVSLFFNHKAAFINLFSKIDMTEVISINQAAKTKNLFSTKGNLKDLSSIFFILGTLLMIYFGASSYKSDRYFFSPSNVFVRFAALNLFFAALLLLFFNLPRLTGIEVNGGRNFLYYSIYALAFLDLFFALGFFVKSTFRKKITQLITCIAIWSFLIIIIPEISSELLKNNANALPSNESLDTIKITELINFEKIVAKERKGIKDIEELRKLYKKLTNQFHNTTYKKNIKVELDVLEMVEKAVEKYEKTAAFFPSAYYDYLCGEISSKGYNGYSQFVRNIVTVRDAFVNFILEKRYASNDEKMENFVKKDENLFRSKSHLPKNYTTALFIPVASTAFLFLASFLILYSRRKKRPVIKADQIPAMEYKKGRSYFILRKMPAEREALFHYYASRENTSVLDKILAEDLDTGIKPAAIFTYYCQTLGTDPTFAEASLKILGIENLRQVKRKDLPPVILKKIYIAAALGQNSKTIVINDFIKGETKAFEAEFIELLLKMESLGKTILYIGSEAYETREWKTQCHEELPDKEILVDLRQISLR